MVQTASQLALSIIEKEFGRYRAVHWRRTHGQETVKSLHVNETGLSSSSHGSMYGPGCMSRRLYLYLYFLYYRFKTQLCNKVIWFMSAGELGGCGETAAHLANQTLDMNPAPTKTVYIWWFFKITAGGGFGNSMAVAAKSLLTLQIRPWIWTQHLQKRLDTSQYIYDEFSR